MDSVWGIVDWLGLREIIIPLQMQLQPDQLMKI